jgi:hypothetical protein
MTKAETARDRRHPRQIDTIVEDEFTAISARLLDRVDAD